MSEGDIPGPNEAASLARALQQQEPSATCQIVTLLRSSGPGRDRALEIVAAAFEPYLTAFIRRRLAGSEDDVVEVWTDVLVRVYERIGKFDSAQSAFRTWVFNQAHYAVIDFRRAATRLDIPVGAPTHEERGNLETFAIPRTKEERAALASAMRRLSTTERQLLWARHVEGLLPSEIAEKRLNGSVPSAHVRVYASRAADRLRAFYESELHRSLGDPLIRQLA